MSFYVLDTNTVSHFIKGHPAVTQRMSNISVTTISISVITEAELRFGIVRRPENKRLHRSIDGFLLQTDIMPWDSKAAKHYASFRAALERIGKGVGALDLSIAAHTVSAGRILVTSDKVLLGLTDLAVEDWTVQT